MDNDHFGIYDETFDLDHDGKLDAVEFGYMMEDEEDDDWDDDDEDEDWDDDDEDEDDWDDEDDDDWDDESDDY